MYPAGTVTETESTGTEVSDRCGTESVNFLFLPLPPLYGFPMIINAQGFGGSHKLKSRVLYDTVFIFNVSSFCTT